VTNPERTTTTRCCLPHRRIRERGEVFTHPDGTEVSADGTEPVWDHERIVHGAWDHALLCTGHLSRLRQIVARTPAMVSWLREHVEPGAVTLDPDAPKSAPGKRTPAPLRLEAVDAADEEVATLASWVQLVAEERGEDTPEMSGVWMVPASRQVDDTHRVATAGRPRLVGLRSLRRELPAAPPVVVAAVEPLPLRNAPRCDLSDLLVSECACRIHAKPAPKCAESEIVARFPARFDSNCDDCGARMREGDPIAKTHDDEYICERCQG